MISEEYERGMKDAMKIAKTYADFKGSQDNAIGEKVAEQVASLIQEKLYLVHLEEEL